MSTSTFTNIRKALVSGVESAAGTTPVAYQNEQFTPPENSPWLASTILQTQPLQASLGGSGQDRHDGILQIDVYTPINEGDILARQIMDQIEDVLKSSTVLTYSDVSVKIESVGISFTAQEGDWFRNTLDLTWFSFVSRG